MKRPGTALWMAAMLLVAAEYQATAQGFQNLDFERPRTPLVPLVGYVPVTDAMPGWTCYIDGERVDWVAYNGISLGGVMIGLLGPDSMLPAIQGSYAVYLQPGLRPPRTDVLQTAIAQTGTIPGTALSLRFYAAYGVPDVSFAGQPLTASYLGRDRGNAGLYGADITRWAGQSGELRFSGWGLLDRIAFSTLPVPEPRALGLLALGVGLLAWRWRRGRSGMRVPRKRP